MNALPALGCREAHPPDHPVHRVRLARYLPEFVADPPPTCNRSRPVSSWGLYGNLDWGTCGLAMVGNAVRAWTANAGAQKNLPEEAAFDAYTTLSGCDFQDRATDTGVVLSDLFALWHASGPGGIGGDVLTAFAEVEHEDAHAIKHTVERFGACMIRLALPKAAQGLDAWIDVPRPAGDVTPPTLYSGPFDLSGAWAPGSWGGHAVPILDYDLDGCTVVTWGNARRMSWGFAAAYLAEAWACLSGDWPAPEGLDLAALRADLAALADPT